MPTGLPDRAIEEGLVRRDVQLRLIKELLSKMDAGTTVEAGGLRRNPTSVYVDPALAEVEWDEFFRSFPQVIGLSGDLARS